MRAAATIPAPKSGAKLRRKDYRTNHIVDLIQEVVETNVHETATFALQFTADRRGLRELFNWVDQNFTYQEDPPNNQWVQTPAYLNSKRVGDCKSYTAFLITTLKNMGLDSIVRYTSYGSSQFRHVYPVAILNGKEIPMDVVWKKQENGRFGAEKPFTKKKDFAVQGLYKLGNSYDHIDEAAVIGELQGKLDEINRISESIPNVVDEGMGDVTRMSKGQVERMIWADRYRVLSGVTKHGGQAGQYLDAARALERGDIAGIGSLQNDPFGRQVQSLLAKTAQMQQPAFETFNIAIPNPLPPEIRGLFKGIGKFIKKVGNAISGVFKKFVNWIFKGAGKKMGPFYMFQFYNQSKVKSPKIRARIREQRKSYDNIRRLGKFDDKQLKGLMLNGIVEATGKSPQQIAQEAQAGQIAGPGLAALVPIVSKAIGFVVSVISKIAGIFKKNSSDVGRVDESTMSDPTLLAEEAELHRQSGSSGPGSSSGSGGFSPLMLLPAVIPFLLK